jgi:hypothetical protein
MRSELRRFVFLSLMVGACGLPTAAGAAATTPVGQALNGKWQWEATCEHGGFHGVMEFNVQDASTFTGQFLNTNFWDKGVMSNGIIRGNHISFDRSYGLIVQHLSADLTGSLREMSGPYDSTMFGKCTLRGKKLQ